jgi:hypothetical protein
MPYIYKIINNVNQKIYIGKTTRTIEERFKEHCKDYKKRDLEKRPLYSAMKKYGIENFSIELVEETDNPEEREKYWIEYYGSFKNGYNATVGGDGKPYIDYDLIVATYKELKIQTAVAKKLNISEDTVSRVLKIKNISSLNQSEAVRLSVGKIVNQYDLQGNYLNSFPSTRSAAESLNKVTSKNNGACSHITDVCKGKRKTAYGYIWKFSE